MSKEAVDALFRAYAALTDIRMILRETVPGHELDPEQKIRTSEALESLEREIATLKQGLVS